MGEKNKTLDTLAMDGKLMARSDAYEIKASRVKVRPPAPAPVVKVSAADKIEPDKKPSK
jgi:hypothetical protein